MKSSSRIVIASLLTLIVILLIVNMRGLYTTPVANTWVWWNGDETQSMVEERSLIETGLYTYRYAHDNTVAHGSGILKGSVWLVGLTYAGPSLLTNTNFVLVGRTINAIFGLLLLGMVYRACRLFGVQPTIAVGGVFLLASSTCYFITSHTARPDIPVGIANLLLLMMAVLARSSPKKVGKSRTNSFIAGILLGASLLVSLHVAIDCTLPVLYILWRTKSLRSAMDVLRFAAGVLTSCIPLSSIYLAATGTFSLLGFFSPSSQMLPINSIFHPRSDISNIILRYFFAREWIPYYIIFGIAIGTALFLMLVSKHRRNSLHLTLAQRIWAEMLPIFIFSTVIFEARRPYYLIFVLPIFTVTLAFFAERIWMTVRKRQWRTGIVISCSVLVLLIAWQSIENNLSMEAIGDLITSNNDAVSRLAYSAILRDAGSNPGKVRVMISAPAMLNLATKEHIEPYTADFLYPDSVFAHTLQNLHARGIQYVVKVTSSNIRDTYEDDEQIESITPADIPTIFQTTSIVSDIGRNYEAGACFGMDTIRVYAVR